MLTRAGLSDADARETAAHIDDTMKDCILGLYRSGRDVFREWGPDLSRVTAPGLVLWGEGDVYAAPVYAERIGEVTGAGVVILPCGHWWQVERPEAAADAILAFRRCFAGS
jgi:pimeloyl-ACP methyl ester carboxylesterase